MIIDLSHSSRKTSRDTMEASEAPVIFSHSSAAAICNSTRNVRDDTLKMVVSIKVSELIENDIV
jgi:membrane dipeptidase